MSKSARGKTDSRETRGKEGLDYIKQVLNEIPDVSLNPYALFNKNKSLYDDSPSRPSRPSRPSGRTEEEPEEKLPMVSPVPKPSRHSGPSRPSGRSEVQEEKSASSQRHTPKEAPPSSSKSSRNPEPESDEEEEQPRRSAQVSGRSAQVSGRSAQVSSDTKSPVQTTRNRGPQTETPRIQGRTKKVFVENEDEILPQFNYISLDDELKVSMPARQMSGIKPKLDRIVIDYTPKKRLTVDSAFRIDIPDTDVIKKEEKGRGVAKKKREISKNDKIDDVVEKLLKYAREGKNFASSRGQGNIEVKDLKEALKGYPGFKITMKKDQLMNLAIEVAKTSGNKELKDYVGISESRSKGRK